MNAQEKRNKLAKIAKLTNDLALALNELRIAQIEYDDAILFVQDSYFEQLEYDKKLQIAERIETKLKEAVQDL